MSFRNNEILLRPSFSILDYQTIDKIELQAMDNSAEPHSWGRKIKSPTEIYFPIEKVISQCSKSVQNTSQNEDESQAMLCHCRRGTHVDFDYLEAYLWHSKFQSHFKMLNADMKEG